MTDQVEEVKQKTDIVSVIGEHVELKKAGRNFKTNCPFHGEKTPSFMVSPELQIYKCFGCGESGDVISFLEKYEGMEFYEALKYLADKAGVKLKPTRFKQHGEKEKLYQINSFAAKFYEYILLKHKAGKVALSYLTSQRGLSLETIKKFRLGYSPDVFFAIKSFLIDKKGFASGDLEKSGIAYKTQRGHVDRFRGRVVFPLFDHRGNVAGFAGRILPSKKKLDLAKYINTPETPVYHKSNLLYGLNVTKSEIKKRGKAVVVEGELDLISSYQAGIKNIVALKGSAFTEGQARLLGRFAKKIILSLDADIAGDVAARRGISIAEEVGMEVSVVKLVGYKDPDDIAGKDPKLYKKLLSKPVGVWDYIVDSTFEKYDISTGAGKAKVSKELIPILATIPDDIVKAHYIEKTARKLNVPTEAVMRQILKVKDSDKNAVVGESGTTREPLKARREILEERFLALLMQGNPNKLIKKGMTSLIKETFTKSLFEEIKKFVKINKWNPKKFAIALPNEIRTGYSDMFLNGSALVDKGGMSVEKEIELVLGELKILEIKEKLDKLTSEIRNLEVHKKHKLLTKKQKEFAKLSNKLSDLEED
jgi:DNA primase